MEEVETVELMVLDMPGEPTEEHPDVDHGRSHPGNIIGHEPGERPWSPRNRLEVPGATGQLPPRGLLPFVRRIRGALPSPLLVRVPMRLRGGREAGSGDVIGVLDVDGAVGGRLPEEGLDGERGRVAEAREVGLGEGAGLGLELVERVALAALPDLLEHLRRRAAAVRGAELLLAGGEEGRGGRGGGGRVGGVGGGGVGVGAGGGGGEKGAVEVGEDVAAGGAVVGGDDLADAEGGGLALDAGEEGDGVGELGLGGAVLRGARQAAEPGRDGGLRHRG